MKQMTGNLLDITDGIIVHGCNCQGVMGAGVAKAIREKWPEVYRNYKLLEGEYGLFLADIQVCIPSVGNSALFDKYNAWVSKDIPPNLIVINAMTQYGYGTDKMQVDYDAVFACFAKVRMIARDTGKAVYFPTIGAGLGGGDWTEIAPRIDAALGDEIDATVVKLA